MQRDPAFRSSEESEEPTEDSGEGIDGVLPRDDDEIDFE
jgi:hypothetical protein